MKTTDETPVRARNFWGWGYQDRFPDEDARRALAEHAAGLLGFPALHPRPLPGLASVVLRAPRVAVPAALADFCTDGHEARVRHTYGRSYPDLVRGFRGEFTHPPDLVATPRAEPDVVAALAWAADAGVAVIPYGGGTSVVGGVEADVGDGYRGALSLDLRAMDRVLEVDPVSRAARIQAGALGPGLEAQLAPHGLTLRHYPQSFEFSTLGGWLATRAGGHFATLYTHVDDLVESIRTVTPAGVMESRRLPASGAGPSPDRWMLGSEGALGVITEAWMRVQLRPRWRLGASVHFERFEQAVDAARGVAQAGLFPSNCRVLDQREAALNLVAQDGSHVLILGFESADHAPRPRMDRALEIALAAGGRCPDGVVAREGAEPAGSAGTTSTGGDAAASWRRAFLEAPYLQSALVSVGVLVDTFETACTWDAFPALHAALVRAVRDAMKRACGRGHLSCRFTHVYPDGPAPYYTFIAPARAGDELAQWAEVKRAASDTLRDHGATITHHHAVGRTHRPWYDRQRPELFAAALRATKGVLDPAGVMNPGVLVDPRPRG